MDMLPLNVAAMESRLDTLRNRLGGSFPANRQFIFHSQLSYRETVRFLALSDPGHKYVEHDKEGEGGID
jgi:hypothetical protein